MQKDLSAPEEVSRSFKQPDIQFRPVVMWFWNDRISKDEITFQIEQFRDSGIFDFFIHPLWGMEIEYLSEDYFELIRHAVDVAKKNNMHYWIYDEYNWPSGMAGGYLLRDEPWTRSRILKSMKVDLFAGQPADICFRGEFLAAQIIYHNKSRQIEDITKSAVIIHEGEMSHLTYVNTSCAGCTIWVYYTDVTRGLTTTGMWSSFSWFQEGYVDTNNPDAVRKFIDYTHERYKAAVGDEFGKTVKGIFTDEVNNMSMFDNAPGCMPWTDRLPDEFRQEHGYSLIPKLYALNCSFTDNEVLKLRYDYWKTCIRLFRDSYMKQVAGWCSDNGLTFTGHLSGECILYWHAFQMGDFYEAMTPFDIPGIDNILSKSYIGDYRFSLAAKLAASVAKYNHKRRVMCETFSGSGWDMKLLDAKRVINRLLVHGINMIMYMGAYYSLDGARKKLPMCYPPSHGYNNPLFKHYKFLNCYTARISYLSSVTYPAGRVVLILPQISQYIHPDQADKLDFSWQGTAEALMRLNIEFDIVFEPLAAKMEVTKGKLKVCEYEYDSVLIPAMHYSSGKMACIINNFIAQGGKTMFINALPEKTVDTGARLNYQNLWGALSGNVIKAFGDAEASSSPVFAKLDCSNISAVVINRMSGNCMQMFMDALYVFLGKWDGTIWIDNSFKNIYASHRSNDEMDLFLIANDNPDKVEIPASVGLTGRLVLMDPCTGESKAVKTRQDGERQYFTVELPGYYMVAVACFKDEETLEAEEPSEKGICTAIPLEGEWEFAAEGGNWLPMRVKLLKDFEQLLVLLRENSYEEFFTAVNAAEKEGSVKFAAGELPGGYGVGFGKEYISAAGFTAEYLPELLELVTELEEGMIVFLNGRRVENFEPLRLWGIREAKADITDIVHTGLNTIVIISRVPAWGAPHTIPSAYIRGGFCLDKSDFLIEPARTIKPECWTRQGYRYYSGNGTYSTNFNIGAYKSVKLHIPTTDAVSIKVNGTEVMVQPWPPYDVNISDFCRQGENTLSLCFTSCYASLMELEKIKLLEQGVTEYIEEPDYIDSGLLSAPELIICRDGGLEI